jgi:hypothetical protein
MSHDAVPSSGPATEHSVAVPGGTIYYRTEGSGPPLVLIGGGLIELPGNHAAMITHPAEFAARLAPLLP